MPRKEQTTMSYAIKYECGTNKSFFARWAGPRFPQFGATEKDAARFDSEQEANAAIANMPITASPCCDAVPVAD